MAVRQCHTIITKEDTLEMFKNLRAEEVQKLKQMQATGSRVFRCYVTLFCTHDLA